MANNKSKITVGVEKIINDIFIQKNVFHSQIFIEFVLAKDRFDSSPNRNEICSGYFAVANKVFHLKLKLILDNLCG